jgi:hypothetical protein
MASRLDLALSNISLKVKIKREYSDNRSAGFYIFDPNTGAELTTIDIDIISVKDSRIYQIGPVSFSGVKPSSVICDKICAISSHLVFRRAKDLLDLYALGHCLTVKTSEIYCALNSTTNTIDSFNEFTTRQSDLRHAFEKLKRIQSKPDFTTVYSYLTDFLEPFIEKNQADLIWDNHRSSWTTAPSMNY